MRRQDFDAVLQEIRNQLREAGYPELADPTQYRAEDDAEPDPRELAVRMLEAFESQLLIQDRATYRKAMSSIRGTMESGSQPRSAVIETDDQARVLPSVGDFVDLSAVAPLGGVRKWVRRLASDLREEPYRERGESEGI